MVVTAAPVADHLAAFGPQFDAIVLQAEEQGYDNLAELARRVRLDVAAVRARFDDFGVQLRLASMDQRDRLGPIVDEVSVRLAAARHALTEMRQRAAMASDALRCGVQAAAGDLELAIEEVVESLR